MLAKIKMIIGISKFDGTKSLIEEDDKLPDDITLKNFVLLIICAFKDTEQNPLTPIQT